jgi:CubicO group peptidase (beta-lactamase class C family)
MKSPVFACCLSFLILSGCAGGRNLDPGYQPSLLMEPPYSRSNDDGFWEVQAVEAVPAFLGALRKHVALCAQTGADSQLVVHKGRIVSEWYSGSYREPVGAMSSTKVVASILIGQLVDGGKLSYAKRVSEVLPEWTGGYRDKVTIEDLLSHSAGFRRRSGKDDSIGYAPDKRAFVLALFPDHEPGLRFEYSNEGIQLLEPVISRLTGRATAEYAQDALFGKLGMEDTRLYDYGGSAWLYAELRTTTRDMARLGLLMLHGGLWKGERIVSEDYVQRATRPSKAWAEMGYAWWIFAADTGLRGFYASGYLNNDIYVFPGADLVIVRTQAPNNGYSGKAESGDYFRQAIPLFRHMVASRP